jgi:hypothetical protein
MCGLKASFLYNEEWKLLLITTISTKKICFPITLARKYITNN